MQVCGCLYHAGRGVDILNYTNWHDFLKWVMQNGNAMNEC